MSRRFRFTVARFTVARFTLFDFKLVCSMVAILSGLVVATSDVVSAATVDGLPKAADVGEAVAGNVELTSIGPIAFAPNGVLLVSDPMAATIYAIETNDTAKRSDQAYHVVDVRSKVAAALGTTAEDVRIVDLAVNPMSGKAYLSVARGSGADASAALLVLDAVGQLSELALEGANHTKAELPNSPESRQTRRGDPRLMTVTDLAYLDGRVIIAGLSNEEFASKLHYLDFPFREVGTGASVEIFHGAHGKVETRSPIMTFCGYTFEKVPHVMAAYTCTPLVAFPVSDLQPGTKVRGKTLAELGNRNRPLDMFVYQKQGQDYILMANSNRGMMKIALDEIASNKEITEAVSGGNTAGLPYDTLEDWQGVLQLDRFDEGRALVLVRQEDGSEDLVTKQLP